MKPKPFCQKLVFAFLALSVTSSGCVKEEDLTSSSSGDTTTTPITSQDGGLYLHFSRAWEQLPDTFFDIGTCTIPVGSAAGTTKSCVITLPEAELFYGKLKMTAGTSDSSTCSIVTLDPFYYRGSDAVGFLAAWETNPTATDCSTSPVATACFNGPATTISGFPIKRGLYSAVDFNPEISHTVDAANTKGQNKNRWTSNALTDRITPIVGWYMGPSADPDEVTWQDYVAECRDAHYELIYRITVVLADEDTSTGEDPGGPTDHFSDWDGL